jgi:Gpi18-like mannosyltransferase
VAYNGYNGERANPLKLSRKFYLTVLGLALALAAFFRFWAAPLSAGPDVAQFWAFARVFHTNGLDFYRYAAGTAAIFPFKSWGFVYPPLWLLLLGAALFLAPGSAATMHLVSRSWRLAMKMPIILADLAIGYLLYRAVPGSRRWKLLFACLWLFHPTAWYESAVFGQFDAVAAALLLAAIVLLEQNRDRLAFLIAGLAVMTKQHTLIPVAAMAVIFARQTGWRRLGGDLAILAGVVVVFSTPFLFTGNFAAYARSLLLPGQEPTYQFPLVYSFGGIGALLTYLHNVFGWETGRFIPFTIPLTVTAVFAVIFFSYRRQITPAQGALASFLAFIGLF